MRFTILLFVLSLAEAFPHGIKTSDEYVLTNIITSRASKKSIGALQLHPSPTSSPARKKYTGKVISKQSTHSTITRPKYTGKPIQTHFTHYTTNKPKYTAKPITATQSRHSIVSRPKYTGRPSTTVTTKPWGTKSITLPSSTEVSSATAISTPVSTASSTFCIAITSTRKPTITVSQPWWSAHEPTEFLNTPTWTTPHAPLCTDRPRPSHTTAINFDNIDVNWWYGMVPQQYEQLHLRNFYIMNDRTLDDPYLDLSVSKHNFAAHPGNYDSTIGAYDESAFIALPDGATFDVISFWLQCDWQCELHIYEQRPNEEEHELLLTTNETPLILEGALATGMAFINLEETFGPGAGKKVVWLRMWARNVTCSGPSGEVAIAMDDLVVARREKSGLSEAGCAELLNTSDAVRWDSDVEFPLGSDGWP